MRNNCGWKFIKKIFCCLSFQFKAITKSFIITRKVLAFILALIMIMQFIIQDINHIAVHNVYAAEIDTVAPSAPSNLAIKSTIGKSITLVWSASTDNVGISKYEIYSNGALIGTTTAKSYTYSRMNEGTLYEFYVIAYDKSLNASNQSNTVQITTEIQAPTTPSNLTITSSVGKSITLGWEASIDNFAVSKYEIYCNGTMIGSTTSKSFTYSKLSEGTSYEFYVIAYDKVLNVSNPSNSVSLTTEIQAPTVPANLTIASTEGKAITLNWEASTDNFAVSKYEIYCNAALIGTTSSTTYTYLKLTEGTSYEFYVIAYDKILNASNHSSTAAITTVMQAPSAPANLTITSTAGNTVTLGWDASTDNFAVKKYDIYCNGNLIGSTSSKTFTYTKLTEGTTYAFNVIAYDTVLNASVPSNTISMTTVMQAPTAPANLAIASTEGKSITLKWEASIDNFAISKYEIYSNGTLIGTTTSKTYTYSKLTEGTSYEFYVIAYDKVLNESNHSNSVIITTEMKAPNAPANLTIMSSAGKVVTLGWDASTDNFAVNKYEIFCNGTLIGATTSRTYTYSRLSEGTAYEFYVIAYDKALNASTSSNAVKMTTEMQAPTAPANLVIISTDGKTVTLGWDASTDNFTVSKYEIYCNGTLVGTTTSKTYTYSKLTEGTAYEFYIVAYDKALNASDSSYTVSMTTDVQSPTAPSNLNITSMAGKTVSLSWEASIDNFTVSKYEIYCNGTLVGTTASKTYTYSKMTEGMTYEFYVIAYDKLLNASNPSNTITLTTEVQAPTPPSMITAINAAGNTITMVWNASTDNFGISKYEIYCNGKLIGTTTKTTYTYSKLTIGSNYDFSVIAYDNLLNASDRSNTFNMTAAEEVDTKAPSAPIHLSATAATGSAITLVWDKSTDDKGVEGYDIYCDGNLIGTTSETSFTYTECAEGISHFFYSIAFDTANNRSNLSNILIMPADPNVIDTEIPSAPANLKVLGVTESSVELQWDAASVDEGILFYEIYCNGSSIGTSTSPVLLYYGYKAGTLYNFFVIAYDEYGNVSSASNLISTDDIVSVPPTAPENLTIVNSSISEILLKWDASVDDTETIIYEVFCNGNSLGMTNNTDFIYADITEGTTYTFYIIAHDISGNSSEQSNHANITIEDTNGDSQNQNAPSNLTIVSIEGSTINLQWDVPADNIRADGYFVFCNGVIIGQTTETNFIYNELIDGITYYFHVTAYDEESMIRSGISNIVILPSVPDSADIQAPSEPLNLTVAEVTDFSVSIQWEASTDDVNVLFYEVYCNGSLVGAISENEFIYYGDREGATCEFYVLACDEASNRSSQSNTFSLEYNDMLPPSSPANVSIISASVSEITLAWENAADNIGVDHYEIYCNGENIGSTIDLSYTYKELDNEMIFEFFVIAYDMAGNSSPQSNIVSITIDTQAPSIPNYLYVILESDNNYYMDWEASEDNIGVARYDIFCNGNIIGSTENVYFTYTGELQGDLLSFFVIAYDQAGNRSEQSNTGTIGDKQAPTAPANLRIISREGETITLQWEEAADNIGVAGYYVYYYDYVYDWTTDTNYTLSVYSEESASYFCVVAYDNENNMSSLSNFAIIPSNPDVNDTQAPSAPSNLRVVAMDSNYIDIEWNEAVDDMGVLFYEIYCNDESIGTTTYPTFSFVRYNDEASYSYYIKAYDEAGNVSDISNILDEFKLPINLEATKVTNNSVTLTWSDLSELTGVYEIYMGYSLVGTTTENSYVVTGLVMEYTYPFKIIEKDETGNLVERSNEITVKTIVAIELEATEITGTTVKLTWNDILMYPEVAEYDVYVNSWDLAGTVTGYSFTKTNLYPGSQFHFSVKAKDAQGNEIYKSNDLYVTTIIDTPVNLKAETCDEGITISWDPIYGAYYYELCINGEIVNPNGTQYIQTDVLPNHSYEYKIRCSERYSNVTSEWSDIITFVTPPGDVMNVLVYEINDATSEITWEIAEGALEYEVEINGTIIGTVEENIYTYHKDPLKLNNTYRVRSVNGELKGRWSAYSSEKTINGGIITKNTVWNGTYTVLGNLTIAQGVTLQLMPGTKVKFADAGLIAKGSIIAQGTAENPIVFTSLPDIDFEMYDEIFWRGIKVESNGEFIGDYVSIKYVWDRTEDTYSGALNINGYLNLNNSVLYDNYYYGISISSGQDISIQNTTIDSIIGNSDNIRIDKSSIETGTVTVKNCVLNNCYDYGIYIDEIGDSGLIFENNTVDGSFYGIYVAGHGSGIFSISDNIISNCIYSRVLDFTNIKSSSVIFAGMKNNSFIDNECNDYMAITGEIKEDITLDSDVFLIIDSLNITEGNTLTLQPGTTIIPGEQFLINGKLIANGTSDKPIVFTSTTDPIYGIDYLEDNMQPYYWGGSICIESTGELVGSYIKIRYGGNDSGYGNVLDVYGCLSLSNSEISNFKATGINLATYNDVTITDSVIDGSDMFNVYIDTKGQLTQTVTLRNNIFKNSYNESIVFSFEVTGNIILENNIIENGIVTRCGIGSLQVRGNTITNSDLNVSVDLENMNSEELDEIVNDNIYVGYTKENVLRIGGTITENITIPAYKYQMGCTIPNGLTMIINPGTIIINYIFKEFHGIPHPTIDIQGDLYAQGTKEEPIIFASFTDPIYGSNWDSLTLELEDYWGYINVGATGEFTGNYVKIISGGDGVGACAVKVEGRLNLYNSEISNSEWIGINFYTTIQPTLMYNTFKNNVIAINNGNSGFIINAKYNYWNSIYGPSAYNVKTNKMEGNGDRCNLFIDYDPYLGSELSMTIHFSNNKGTYAPTGNYSNQFTDLEVNCLDDAIAFTRSYNSQDTDETGVFGKGWSFNYNSYIKDYEEIDNIKQVKLPDGSEDSFMVNEDGTFSSCNSRNTLIKEEDGSYILTLKDQTKYGFNNEGFLTWMENSEGNRITISIDDNGKPTCITDYFGRTYNLTYQNNLLNIITDPMGRTIRYYYDNSKLIKVVDPEGIVTNYIYDENGNLAKITDGNNNSIESIIYKESNGVTKVDSVTDAFGNFKTYTYNEQLGKTIITDSNGRTTAQWYDSTYNITNSVDAEGKITSAVYYTDDGVNKYGEISSTTDRYGNTTKYLRDDRGNYTKVTNPDNGYKLYTYDEKNNLTSERDEAGKYTYYIYDDTKTYLLKAIKPLNGTDAYTESSDLSEFAITTYTYYEKGENGYNVNGLIRTITDPEGDAVTYTYDGYGNIKTSTDSASNTTTYTYNEVGFLLSTLSPKGELTSYTYDNNGNLETKVLDGGETSVIEYDGLGRKVKEITPNIYQLTPSGDVGYRYSYYSNGKLQSVKDPEGNITFYTYDLYGNLISETKLNSCVYWYEYDVLNRVTAVYIQETAAEPKVLLKSYAYTVLTDKKIQMTETVYLNSSDTAITINIYDYAGRLVKQTNPDGGILNTVYNTNGTVYSQSDAKGKITYNRYDGLNRLTEQWIPIGDSKYTYKAFTYDRNNNVTAEKTGVEAVTQWGIPAILITTSYTYNDINQLVTVTDPEGGKKEYEYDASGNIIKETIYLDSVKTKVTEYVYNHLGKADSMTVHVDTGDIYGNTFGDTTDILLTTSYTYDADSNVKTMITPDGITTVYTYDCMDRLLSQSAEGEDEYGSAALITTSYTYDYAGNVLTSTDANGNTTVNTYSQRVLLEKMVDSEGGITAYYYDNAGRMVAKVLPENYYESVALADMNRVAFTYDKMNRVILEQDIYYDDNTLTFRTINSMAYLYDLNGNTIKTLDALGYNSGTGTTIAGKISTGYGTYYTYNDANLLLTALSPVSRDNALTFDFKYAYDAAGRKISETNANNTITKYYYDNNGRLVRTAVIDTTEKIMQQITYDGMSNILTQMDGNGNVTTFTYNKLGLLRSKTTQGDATIDAYTVINQYTELSQLAYQKDSLNKVIIYSYNHNGKVLSQTERKADGTKSISISSAYDNNGNLRFATDANGVVTENVYDGLNRVSQTKITVNGVRQITSYTYDKNGNLLTSTDWLGNTYTSEYDALNRIVRKTDPYGKVIEQYEYNDNHAQVTAYDALGNMTAFTYDKNNRLLSTTDPAGHVNSQTYDKVGNIASKKDGKNNVITYTYDFLNRLAKVTNAKGEITNYTYDLNGNLLTQADAKGNITRYTYNSDNLPVIKSDPVNISGIINKEYYTYYADGKLKTKTDRSGNVTEYTYDIHGNLLSEVIGGSAISYTYDPTGHMLTMSDPTGITRRTYDELGRVLTKTVPDIGTITFEYDIITGLDQGCYKEKSTDSEGNVTEKVYDRADRLSMVIAGTDETVYTYYDNGNRSSVTYSNGSKEEYTYFANNQVKTLVNKKSDGSIMDSYSYTYDNAGNQLNKQETINGIVKGTTSYTYDTLNRLLTVTEPNGRVTTYTYDSVGNRATETVTYVGMTTLNNYVYNNQNRLTDINTKVNNVLIEATNYTYDNNGNQLTTVVKTYVSGIITSVIITATNIYDLHNQLTKTITEDGTEVNNSYNAEGYRVGKEANGEQTIYLYEADKVILEVDGAGNQTARNVYGTNLLLRTVGGETYYYLYNGHADVTALMTTDGNIAATYYYDAFGNILESTGDVDNSILYSGYQYDKETGLYYLNARMYDPKIARFLQEDTFTGAPNDPLSLNLYTYCANNPLIYLDPTGHNYYDGTKWVSSLPDTTVKVKQKKEKKTSLKQIAKDLFNYGNINRPGDFTGALSDGAMDNIVEGIIDTGDVIVNAVKHPAETFLALENINRNPSLLIEQVYNNVKTDFEKEVINGDPFTAAHFGGGIIGDIGFDILVTKGMNKATKLIKSIKTTKVVTKVKDVEAVIDNSKYLGEIEEAVIVPKGVPEIGTDSTALTVYDPQFAVRQALEGGSVSENTLRTMIPDGMPNTFTPSSTITDGYKFNYDINGTKMEVKWHSADANAAAKFPGSNSGIGWSAQIKVDNKLLGLDGSFYRNFNNLTHIPMIGGSQ